MRRAARLDGLQADKPSDAMIDMNDDIAGRQRADFAQKILRAPRLFAAAQQAIAQNILLADYDEIAGLETGLKANDRHGHA